MTDTLRDLTALDRIFSVIDQCLRISVAGPGTVPASGRPVPAPAPGYESAPLAAAAARHAAGLMRVNHAGEVAAQALYHGQALVARDAATRDFLLAAAREEGDHLVWCAARLKQLGSRSSVLDPLWYAGSVAIGALAGLAGDRVSLGFLAETERQVEGHLASHLEQLPAADGASRAIVEQMKADEAAHRDHALARGGEELPAPVRGIMRAVAKVMTGSAYWL